MSNNVLPQDPLPENEQPPKGLWPRFRTWTGFGSYVDTNGKRQHGKTLWDWMQLLIVPALLAGGLAVFNKVNQDNQLALNLQSHQNELNTADDAAKETALENYIDRMRDLLITDKLGQPDTPPQVTIVAQTLTLTVVHRLDAKRIGSVVTFLCRAKLIQLMTSGGFSLSGTDLSNLNLFNCDLSSADLSNTNLSGANLTLAVLASARLSGANLSGATLYNAELDNANLKDANLSGADLSLANLFGATVTDDQLASAKSVSGATMPDGTVNPDTIPAT